MDGDAEYLTSQGQASHDSHKDPVEGVSGLRKETG
jgi:hypothetical protein